MQPKIKKLGNGVSVVVWENHSDNGKTYYTFTLAKPSKDKATGVWTNSSTFGWNDLPTLQHLLNDAIGDVLALQAAVKHDTVRPLSTEVKM